jgi:uncharacterized membrane protein
MSQSGAGVSDQRVDQVLGNVLRAGVILAAVVVLAGAVLYLTRHGREPTHYKEFHGAPPDLRSPVGVVQDALAVSARGIIQLGLLVLVATPVARVLFSAIAFALQRDLTYVVLTLIVLAVLLYSLFAGDLG